MKFIDVSGFGHTGKTAITDYLKQFDTVLHFPNYMEFELFRVPNGLLDMYFALYESWNLIRSTVCIKEFKKLVKRIGVVQDKYNPTSYFIASAHGYDQYFNNKFIALSNKLIDDIVISQQYTFWPYENLRVSPINVFINKFKSKFFNSLTSTIIYYSDRAAFLKHVSDYMQDLFKEAAQPHHTHVVLNNAFEPFNPSLCIEMVGNACCVVVDRDPRDIYASLLDSAEVYVPDFEKDKKILKIKKQLTNFDDIEIFIKRFKTLRQNISSRDEGKVLRLKYEDFLLDHQNQTEILKKFVEIPINAKLIDTNFDYQKSLKNVGIWKKYAATKEIMLIEKELREYCYQR